MRQHQSKVWCDVQAKICRREEVVGGLLFIPNDHTQDADLVLTSDRWLVAAAQRMQKNIFASFLTLFSSCTQKTELISIYMYLNSCRYMYGDS